MRFTRSLLAQGFLRRSLDEFKRVSNIVYNQEGIKGASTPYYLLRFDQPGSVNGCKKMSDHDLGGSSTVHLDYHGPDAGTPPHARFHGNISIELPKNKPDVQRTGYAAWRSKDRPATIFGRSLWDIDPYTYIALRVKSDGRKYFVNLQTDSIVPTDIHQHRLNARNPGEWETVFIKWHEFVRTSFGVVVEPQAEMLRQKLRSVGIGLIDRIPGKYDLSIASVWATNELQDVEHRDETH